VTRDVFGLLTLHVDSDEEYPEIRPARSFPHTSPSAFISLSVPDRGEIGVIEDMDALDRQSRQLLEEELELLYFSPVIQRITKVDQHYGASSWHVQTDRGPQIVRVRERSDIRWLGPGKVILTDVHGVRYHVQDSSALDETSRLILEQET
jgi:hypothetical protein